LRPPRDEAPAHLLRDTLAVLTANGHQHRIGGTDVPRRRNVRRRKVRVELELDPGFRIVGREAGTSTHGLDIWAAFAQFQAAAPVSTVSRRQNPWPPAVRNSPKGAPVNAATDNRRALWPIQS